MLLVEYPETRESHDSFQVSGQGPGQPNSLVGVERGLCDFGEIRPWRGEEGLGAVDI